jgi:hypothetical protein
LCADVDDIVLDIFKQARLSNYQFPYAVSLQYALFPHLSLSLIELIDNL